ncbi:hypothetical protein [Pseudomonas aeruginosa]|uniref:hypothetical protein n=1 Tax=Pseudomonas aeruginosa TaxID=287 RepID=UPI003EE30367
MKANKEYLSKILNAETIEELSGIGQAREIVSALNTALNPLTFEADSYEEILDATRAIRKTWPVADQGPFVSRQAEVAFYLTQTDGKLRKKFLKITDEHYRDRKLAKKWFKSLAQIIHSDKIGEDPVPFQMLCKIYEEMTHEGDDDE